MIAHLPFQPKTRNSLPSFNNKLSTTVSEPAPTKAISAALAHELRNPMTNINLAVELLRYTCTNEQETVYLDMIQRATQKLDNMVNALLQKQQPGSSSIKTFSPRALLEEVVASVADRLEIRKIAVSRFYDPLDFLFTGDYNGTRICFTNIIINAIDSMVSGKGHLKIATKFIGSYFTVRIEDNGCGISPENLNHIFEPFYTSKKEGLGIGLSTTIEILNANHVKVRVGSKPGKGTHFNLSFQKSH